MATSSPADVRGRLQRYFWLSFVISSFHLLHRCGDIRTCMHARTHTCTRSVRTCTHTVAHTSHMQSAYPTPRTWTPAPAPAPATAPAPAPACTYAHTQARTQAPTHHACAAALAHTQWRMNCQECIHTFTCTHMHT
jgi:hypothetical protein